MLQSPERMWRRENVTISHTELDSTKELERVVCVSSLFCKRQIKISL
jgi:hypothetical protein